MNSSHLIHTATGQMPHGRKIPLLGGMGSELKLPLGNRRSKRLPVCIGRVAMLVSTPGFKKGS
jgi:hypothetical protein